MDASEQKVLEAIRILSAEVGLDVQTTISKDPFARNVQRTSFHSLQRLSTLEDFNKLDLQSDSKRLFVFINTATKSFAILLTPPAYELLDARYWAELERLFKLDLMGTHHRNALALFLQTLRVSLTQGGGKRRDK